ERQRRWSYQSLIYADPLPPIVSGPSPFVPWIGPLGKVLCPPRARRGPGPSPEGMAEGAELGIAPQEGGLGEGGVGGPRISEGQIVAKLVQDLREAHPKVAEPPGQSAHAHPELMGDELGFGFSSAEELRDDLLDPMAQIGRAVLPAGQDLLAVAGQKPMEP